MAYYCKRVDKNQNHIVSVFRKLGASVYILSMVGKNFPDIAIGFRGRTVLIEIKDAAGKLTEGQERFFEEWKGDVRIVRNDDDVINIMSELGY